MSTSHVLSSERLKSIVEEWKSTTTTIAINGNTNSNNSATNNFLFCVFGDMTTNTLENQRGSSILQYLFNAKTALSNTAMLFSHHSALFIHDEQIELSMTDAIDDYTVDFLRLSNEELTDSINPTSRLMETLKNSMLSFLASSPSSSLLEESENNSHNHNSIRIGAAMKELEIQEGHFALSVIQAMRHFTSEPPSTSCQITLTDAAPFIGSLLFIKDDVAMSSMEKAAGLCSAVFRRYARPVIEEEMVKSSPKTLFALREELCERLSHPNTVHGLESLTADEFTVAAGLTPCVFCQHCYVASIQVNESDIHDQLMQPLRGDVVVVRFGVKHFGHTAFIARTLLVKRNAPANAQDCYTFVHHVVDKVISLLVPGKVLSEVYTEAMQYAQELNADLAVYLPKSFGFSTGLLVLESRATISPKGSAVVANNMCFVVRITLENVKGMNSSDSSNSSNNSNEENAEAAEKVFSVELADTVVVRNGMAELKTKLARKVEDILYEDAGEADVVELQTRDLTKITRQGQSDTIIVSREAQRDEELRKLLRELHAEFLANGGKKGAQVTTEEYRYYDIGRLSFGELNPFKSNSSNGNGVSEQATQQPPFYVSTEKKVVWLPVGEMVSMFHISTINKVDVQKQGDRFVMTIVFHSLQEANIGYKLNRTKVFLKELNYASPRDIFTDVHGAIQACQQRIKNDDAARKREATSAHYGKLQIVPNALRLPQVKMRPPVIVGRQNKSCVGNLELHANGLRFTFLGGAPIDMPFDNIKHVIFQPAVNSIAVIYHITLKRAIELGRKACTEIQFVAEVMESSEAASGARRSFEEEVMAEQRDEMRVKETNKQFITFARAVEERSKIKTQLPTSKFTFDGVHTRAMTTFRGSREVLWAISDWPAFTQSVEEVEVISFERVVPGGSTFDMTLILKDYTKPVITINSIPKTSLEVLKDWCLAARLYYMETTVNPNWKVAMKDIRDDEDWDPWLPGAGWSVLNNEHSDDEDNDDDDDDEDDSESDSTYYEEEDEETDTDDSSWLEDDEESASDSNNDEDDDEEDDSSDVSWEELERKALAHDRKRNFSDDDEDEGRRNRNNRGARQSRVQDRKRGREENGYGTVNRNGNSAAQINGQSGGSGNAAMRPAGALNRKAPMSTMFNRNTVPPPPLTSTSSSFPASTMRRF